MGKKQTAELARMLDAIEHARQDGYDAGYADGLVDGSSSPPSLFLAHDRPARQLIQQGQVRQGR